MIFGVVCFFTVLIIIIGTVYGINDDSKKKYAKRSNWTDNDLAVIIKEKLKQPPAGFFFKVESRLHKRTFTNKNEVVMIHECCGKDSGSNKDHEHETRIMTISICETSGSVVSSKEVELDTFFKASSTVLRLTQLPLNKLLEQIDIVIKQLTASVAGLSTGPNWTGEFYGITD